MLYYGVLLFFVLEYVRPVKYFPFLSVLHLNSIIPISVAVLSLRKNKIVSNFDFMRLSNTIYIFIFLILIGIGVLWADVTYYVWLKFSVVLGWFLIYLAIIKNVDGKKGLAGVFTIMILCHLTLLVLSPDVILHPEIRTYIGQESFLGDGNDFALSLNIVIPYCIYLYSGNNSKLLKLFFLALTVLFAIAVIATSSRGGSLGLAVVLSYQLFKSDNKKIGLAGMAVLIILVLSYAPANYFQRMGTIQDYESEGSAMGRIMAWNSSIRMAADHPFTGVGAGHFPVKYGIEYRPPGVGRTEIPWSNAHSAYFLALGELGIPGLLVVLGLIISNFMRNSKIIRSLGINNVSEFHLSYKRLFVCLNSSLIGFAVAGAFLSVTYYPHLYILAGLMEAARHSFQRRQEKVENGPLPTPT